jgi:hypothetical protein
MDPVFKDGRIILLHMGRYDSNRCDEYHSLYRIQYHIFPKKDKKKKKRKRTKKQGSDLAGT